MRSLPDNNSRASPKHLTKAHSTTISMKKWQWCVENVTGTEMTEVRHAPTHKVRLETAYFHNLVVSRCSGSVEHLPIKVQTMSLRNYVYEIVYR